MPGTGRVVVIGGGPAGLAVAATLKEKGISALVLDKADEVGASWKGHYDRLHLHTVRWLSALPGLKIPRSEGKWVPRDGVVRYLNRYARHHDLRIQLSTTVTSLDRNGSVWEIGTTNGTIAADTVVIATGYNREVVMPEWPGADTFTRKLIHSSSYRTGADYTDKGVLVIGTGNSGAEIVVDLLENRAADVWLSVRTPPNIMRRDVAGFPTQVLGIGLRKLPGPVLDRVSRVTQRLTIGDLSKYGLPPPPRGIYSRVREEERIPVLDVGLVRAVKKREVTVVEAVERFEGAEVVLVNGDRLKPDAVIAATGFRRGLEDLVGHLGVLNQRGGPLVHGEETHPRAPGLHFIGYSNPLSGNLRELGIDAHRIARSLARNG